MGDGFLTEAEMTQGQSHYQGPPNTGELHRSWKHGSPCTACRHLIRLKSILSKWLSGCELLEGSSASASSRQLASKQSSLQLGSSERPLHRLTCGRMTSLWYTLRREGPSGSGRFQWLLRSILSCLPSILRSFRETKCFSHGGNCQTTINYYKLVYKLL